MKTAITALLVFLNLFLFIAPINAFDDYEPSIDTRAKAGLAGCRSFAASYKSHGLLEDRQNFQDAFGLPMDVNVSPYDDDDVVANYRFDSLTKITLDCQDGRCTIRCSPM